MKPLRYPAISHEPENVKPIGDFVLVRPLLNEEKDGSIFLPDNARNPEEGLRRGVVVACGPGDKIVMNPVFNVPGLMFFKRAEMHIHPGDEIIYPRVPANVVNLNGCEYVLLHEEQHVLAVLEKE